MLCCTCGARTRVVHTQHKPEGTHRWLRCLECGGLSRTLETYLNADLRRAIKPPRPHKVAKGSAHACAVLTERDIQRLRSEAAAGERQIDLAKRYGISQSTVSKIVRRERWTHI